MMCMISESELHHRFMMYILSKSHLYQGVMIRIISERSQRLRSLAVYCGSKHLICQSYFFGIYLSVTPVCCCNVMLSCYDWCECVSECLEPW